MAAVQMNTRIDSALKGAGDLVIRECGFTPSDVVRKVWSFAARNRHRPDAVRELLSLLDEGEPLPCAADAPQEAAAHAAVRGPQIVEQFCQSVGIDPTGLQPTSFDQLKEAAFDDELAEWGTL